MKKNIPSILVSACMLMTFSLYLFVSNSSDNSTQAAVKSKQFWSTKKSKVKSGSDAFMKPDGYINYYNSISKKLDQNTSSYRDGYRFQELNKSLLRKGNLRTSNNLTADFIARGPGNVGGRTRAIAVDPDDNTNCTWIAGAASGGLWKTTDCGSSWENISPSIPNLSTNSIAQSQSNPNVIYVGTGEVFAGNAAFVRGDGIYKSTDRGASWELLESTISNVAFNSVNRIAIDPLDENIVVIATNSGIYKSYDGGNEWAAKYLPEGGEPSTFRSVQDLQVDPDDYNTQYAGVNGLGIVKSVDAGETWELSSEGITNGARFEIGISPSNTDVIYTSTFGTDQSTILYYSGDKGATWFEVSDDDSNTDFLGGQGWYDNTIAVNPYDPSEVFVGGVNIGKYKVDFNNIEESDRQFLGLEFVNTEFLNFINFGADFAEGILNISTGNLSPSENPVTVEIRFGGDNAQKAHRFSVPSNGGANADGGAGIPETQYNLKITLKYHLKYGILRMIGS